MLIISVSIPLFLGVKHNVTHSTNVHPIVFMLVFNMSFMVNESFKLLWALGTFLAVMRSHPPDVIAQAGLKVMSHSTLDTEVALSLIHI